MKTAIVFGTRPEIIKLSPIINRLNKKNNSLIFTGQHYDYEMSLRFLKDLKIRSPEYKIKLEKLPVNPYEKATQIGEMVLKLSKIIGNLKPDTVMVQGDTNTVLAAVIAGIKCNVPISHVESGLRSYDWRMPEEHNRITADHLSEILFAPTIDTKKILLNEKVHGRIYVTGNTSIDAIQHNIKNIEKKSKINLETNDFVLATIHRAENVDNKKTLSSILAALLSSKIKIIFPIHPRTIKRLKEFGFYNKIKNSKIISLIPSVGYFDMLYLMKNCNFIITDSGGIQEEATSPKIRKKVIVVRKTTDRPESVKYGYSEVVGTNTKNIINAINRTMKNPKILSHVNPYGNGNASKKIIDILYKNF